MSPKRIIAHRGSHLELPENSLAAFRCAAKHGITRIEFDVALSKDKKCIVFHDQTVDRITKRSGRVDELSLDQLQALNLGHGQRIPSLAQTLACFNELGVTPHLEIKPTRPDLAEETAKAIWQDIQAYWPRSTKDMLISSFNWQALYTIRDAGYDGPIALLMKTWQSDWLTHAIALKSTTINIKISLATRENIKRLKQHGMTVNVFTINNPTLAHCLFKRGVDSVFSDRVRWLFLEQCSVHRVVPGGRVTR